MQPKMATWSCPICTSSKHGKYTSVCNHEICGRCFITLHTDALNAWSSHAKSKCPFCRQVFPFEERSLNKMRCSMETIRWLRVRKQQLRGDIKRLIRLRRTLACSLK